LPEQWGRLKDVIAENNGDRMVIVEHRVIPFAITMRHWSRSEKALALVIYLVEMSLPGSFGYKVAVVATVGLRAVIARFERGRRQDHRSTVRSLIPIYGAAAGVLRAGGRFEVPVDDGSWAGRVMFLRGLPMLHVETFVPGADVRGLH
jgi:hypothetical protein